ncbi:hypothetical protein H0H92_011507 [Tricholoma furcatifolium]|nr:hypothetical protein H0H92_011507 [Tricholoma furcatifolium]
MLPIIDPEDDYLTIVAAEEKIAATEARRKKELEEAHANMKALAKILEAARISSKRPASVPSEQAHAKMVNELDRTKLDLMKSITDMEGHIANQEAELAKLKDEVRQLEQQDPAMEHDNELDATALRLRVYEKMGFQPIFDKKGALVKMVVRTQSGDFHVVPLDEEQSAFEQSRLLWKAASS